MVQCAMEPVASGECGEGRRPSAGAVALAQMSVGDRQQQCARCVARGQLPRYILAAALLKSIRD